MIRINVGNITSQIIGDLPDFEFGQLRHVVSYEDREAYMKQRIAKYRVPERVFLITEKKRVFRTGLLRLVCVTLENLGVGFEINDLRLSGPADHFMGMSVPDSYFRDYQLEAIDTAIKEKTGMLRIATGGGKTSVICGVVAKLERNSVILVHRIDLLNQVYETLNRLLLYPEIIGRVGSGSYEPNIITVATVQTICAALGINYEAGEDDDKEDSRAIRGARAHSEEIEKMLLGAHVICVDEAHHTPARTISEVLKRCTNATWRIGFTATDWRDDGADLLIEAAIGPRIFDRSLSDLVEAGWLVPAQVTMLPQESSEECYSDQWNTIYSHYYTKNQAFNEQVVDQNVILYGANRHILTLVTSVAHGALLAKMHNNVGIPTVFLSGKDTTKRRKEVLDDVRSGHLRHLIGTSIADEGLDMPIIDALNLAGGGKSTTKVYQRIGRTLRPYGNKTQSIVVDYRPDHDKLKAHAGRRANIYRKERAFKFTEIKKGK